MVPQTKTLETDRALLDAYRRGDRAALGEVFELYVDDVTRTLRAGVLVHVDGRPLRVGRDFDEAVIEGLVHDTFARAFAPSARTAYDGLRPFGAYLATIARNLLIDEGRRRVRASRFEVAPVDLERHASDSDPPVAEVSLEEKELQGLVATFASALGEPDRTIFHLRYREEQSHRATAQAVSLTEIQVRRRDTKIRVALLALLREHGYLRESRVAIGSSLLARRSTSENEG